MRIVTLGRGNVGGGLAERWRRAGHDVTELGHEGGDASGADAMLLAVPWRTVADALAKVTGLGSTPVIDATNVIGGDRPEGFASLAEYVKSLTGGPVAKSFSANFARLYDRLDGLDVRPGNVFAADEDARSVTEALIRDAGYGPVYAGDLTAARAVEDFLGILFALAGARGPVFYRFGGPDDF